MKNITFTWLAITLLFACTKNEPAADNATASNEQRMRDFYEQVMNAHNPAMVDSFCTGDFKDQQMPEGYPGGADGLKKFFSDLFTAYPDLKVEVRYIKSWNDTIMSHIRMTGTNSGPFMGMPATNKKIDIEGVDFIKIKDGKATDHWGYQEESKMMMQLGLMQHGDTIKS